MRKPKVCVVLLNWNGRDDTLACLDSLVEILRQREPHVKLFANEENSGFTGGNDQGIRYGLENGSDYVLLLNNDTIVDRQCISDLVTVAEDNPAAGALGPKIYYHDEPKRIWSVGGIINFTENVAKSRGHGRIDRGQFDQPAEVDYISGCAVIVPRRVVKVVGLLSEDFYPAYYEDTNWGMRIRAAGYVNLAVP